MWKNRTDVTFDFDSVPSTLYITVSAAYLLNLRFLVKVCREDVFQDKGVSRGRIVLISPLTLTP